MPRVQKVAAHKRPLILARFEIPDPILAVDGFVMIENLESVQRFELDPPKSKVA